MTIKRSPREVEDFHEAQALSSRRLGFSVTQACPLRCAHCSASAAPDLGATTFGAAFTERVVGQMAAIAGAGITSIDFTGGEPTLAARFVREVSAAADANGITCGIVSAAHWATSGAHARRFLDRFPHVTAWDISTDVYHLPFVPLDRVRIAFEALSERGQPPLIRIAHHEPITYEDAVLVEEVMSFAGRRIGFQPIGPVGRGANIVADAPGSLDDWDKGPCPTTGPLVRTDGRVAPCCAPASHEERDHPLYLGNVLIEPIAAVIARWRTHPLLQTIRLWGFEPVLDWLREAGWVRDDFVGRRACDHCIRMLRNPEAARIACDRAATLDHRIRLAYALLTHFDEPWMDRLLRREADHYLAHGDWVALAPAA